MLRWSLQCAMRCLLRCEFSELAQKSYMLMQTISLCSRMGCFGKEYMMVNTTNPAKGHAAGSESGQELGLWNEDALLQCIQAQGWVRAYEASLLCGMSEFTVGVVSRRLEKKGWIHRKRLHGNAGHFLWLTCAGADKLECKFDAELKVPDSWAHDALAIQTLHYLAGAYACKFVTEKVMQRGALSGKFPDGKLVHGLTLFYFEQEHARKSGALLRSQTSTVARLANEGRVCFVAYPYPVETCGPVDHETRQTNSLRHKWGSPDAPNIKLVRCHFDSKLGYHNKRVSRFEIIDLPAMVDTPASRKPQPGIADQVKGFKWKTYDISQPGMPRRTEAILTHNDVEKFRGVFIKSVEFEGSHVLEVNGMEEESAYDMDETFEEFIFRCQKQIVREIEEDMRSNAS